MNRECMVAPREEGDRQASEPGRKDKERPKTGDELNQGSVNLLTLVLKYVTDVVPNLQTVIWLGLSESFVHNLALSFAYEHCCR